MTQKDFLSPQGSVPVRYSIQFIGNIEGLQDIKDYMRCINGKYRGFFTIRYPCWHCD